MSSFKKFIRIVHLYLGLVSGIIVFIVAVTGCLYSFEKEFRSYMYKEITFANLGSGKTIAIDDLHLIVKKKYPKEKIKTIIIRADKNACVAFLLPKKKIVYVNPYNGEIQGLVNSEEDFFGIVLKIHRSLYLGDVGKKITGISAIVFLVMLISGIILWFPKRVRNLKNKFSLALKANKSRRNYDLHSVLGFYASIFLLFVVLTGLIWSFKSVENSLYWVTGSKKEDRQKDQSNYLAKSLAFSLQSRIDVFTKHSNERDDYFINLPEDSVGVIKFRAQSSNEFFFMQRNQYIFDQYTGELIKTNLHYKASIADKIKGNLYNIHTGKILGLAGQVIVFIASLIAASLPITGFLIWWRRGRGKLKR